MSRLYKLAQMCLLGLFLFAIPSPVNVEGAITGVNNAGQIILAPPSVEDSGAMPSLQNGFNEVQNFTLTDPLQLDIGTLPVGTVVSSHMIFMNPAGASTHGPVTWTFDGLVVGTMSDTAGLLEALSNADLGNLGTVYPGAFSGRGLEDSDGLVFVDDTLTANMGVFGGDPGDWVRVVTVQIPEPSTYMLIAGFLSLAAILRKRRQKLSPSVG